MLPRQNAHGWKAAKHDDGHVEGGRLVRTNLAAGMIFFD